MARAFGILLLGLTACSHSVEIPQPKLAKISPGLACAAGRSTLLSVLGENLIPFESQALTGAELEVPTVQLERVLALDGQAASDLLPIPDDDPAHTDVVWVNSTSLAVTLCPPGTCGALTPARTDLPSLPAGLYDLLVGNPTGGAARATHALAAVPGPRLDSLVPSEVQRGAFSQVTISGDYLLKVGADLGSIVIGGHQLTPSMLADCRSLPTPDGAPVEACRTALVALPSDSFQPGAQMVSALAAAPLDCASNALTLTVTP